MSTLMYDSVDPYAIPTDARMVAGYIDGESYRWPVSAWNRWPASTIKVRIARRVTTNDGHVLDVESGIPTVWPPTQAIVDWVRMRRAAGIDPVIYCNQLNDWQRIRDIFGFAGEPQPHWWVARYNNDPTVPPGAIAKQYINPPRSGGHYDLSNVIFWPGTESDMSLSDEKFTFTAPDGVERTVSGLAMLGNLYASKFYGSTTAQWAGKSDRELLLGLSGMSSDDLNQIADQVSTRLVENGITVDGDALAVAMRDAFRTLAG